MNDFSCSCLSTYTGSNCEADIDECASATSNSCKEGQGLCVNEVDGYSCDCYSGFSVCE